MTGGISHWDAVEARAFATGELRGSRRRLGPAVGAERAGLSRYEVAPGERPMPLHTHADEEEILFVVRGSGITTDGERSWAIAAGDTVAHPAGGAPHTFVAGDEGLDVLVFATGSDTRLTWLPRAGTMWAGSRWIPLDGPHPFAAEAAAGPLDPGPLQDEPAANVVTLAGAPLIERTFSDVAVERRRTGTAAGASRSGLSHLVVAPHRRSSIPHTHSAVEELFVVLGGSGTLELHDAGAECVASHPVRAGTIAGRPAASGLSHSFLAGEEGLTLLAYSRDDPNDLCFYPRSQKLSADGLGDIVFHVRRTTYEDGEPSPAS